MKYGDVGERIGNGTAIVPQRGRECTALGTNSVNAVPLTTEGRPGESKAQVHNLETRQRVLPPCARHTPRDPGKLGTA
jgi:hypothetical protein